MGYRIETPTPEHWQVSVWMFIVVLAILGSVGLWFGFRGPADQPDISRHLIWIGGSAWMAAMAVWGFKRGAEWLLGWTVG